MADNDEGPTAVASLLSAYAGRDAARHRLLWTLDARLARLVASTTEPMIGQIRLAWWSDALTDESGVKGRGEPLVDALREAGIAPPTGLSDWLDGWESLIGEPDLVGYAVGRGGGLFRSLAGEDDVPDWLTDAGAVWALWDLSGHVSDVAIASQAMAMGRDRLLSGQPHWPRAWRPMRIAYTLACHDIMRGRPAPHGLTLRLYMRLVRTALMAR